MSIGDLNNPLHRRLAIEIGWEIRYRARDEFTGFIRL